MRSILLSIPVLTVALLLEARACDCAPNPPPKEALAKAAAVFSAKVIKIEDDGAAGRKVTLTIQEVWKGVDGKTVVVSTAKSGAACGYGFQQDQSYLVYAYKEGAGLRVSLCSRTTPLDKAKDDLKEIGQGKAPEGK